MEFFTTKYINLLIKDRYLDFIEKYYSDILANPNKYIELAESKIAEYLWGGYVKLLWSGTTALQFWLLSFGIQPGDEVILPANTYAATAIAITNIGAIPVFCDISLSNFTMCPIDMEKKITKKTRAIIPVHLYGHNCDMSAILSIAKRYSIPVLEDASHAFWGEYWWRKLWTLWEIGAFSAHVSKNFWTLWNGWIFFTKNKTLFDTISTYIFPDNPSLNILRSWRTPGNIGAFDAVILFLKLGIIDQIIASNMDQYEYILEKNKNRGFTFPVLDLQKNRLHLRNFTVLCNDNRDDFIKRSEGKNYYGLNLSEHPAFNENGHPPLKNTDVFFLKNLSLNFYFGNNYK